MEMAGTRRGLRASAVAALAFGLVALGTWGGEAASSKEAMLLSFAGRACDLSAVLKLAAQEAGQALTSAPQLAGGRADGDASSAARRLARARESMAAARAHEANATLARIEAWLDTVADAERALREHALLGELVKTQATLAAQHIDDFIYTFAKHSGDAAGTTAGNVACLIVSADNPGANIFWDSADNTLKAVKIGTSGSGATAVTELQGCFFDAKNETTLWAAAVEKGKTAFSKECAQTCKSTHQRLEKAVEALVATDPDTADFGAVSSGSQQTLANSPCTTLTAVANSWTTSGTGLKQGVPVRWAGLWDIKATQASQSPTATWVGGATLKEAKGPLLGLGARMQRQAALKQRIEKACARQAWDTEGLAAQLCRAGTADKALQRIETLAAEATNRTDEAHEREEGQSSNEATRESSRGGPSNAAAKKDHQNEESRGAGKGTPRHEEARTQTGSALTGKLTQAALIGATLLRG
ncbi:hypothetical protein, conserved in T. vivax [Trypanosoma vivax Y486]|uniref:Uncharacterized protein n=1 Tax=Trypanosoma vivax (strain Y486) TaxID=1055687 RepID=F9WSM3_TRYVY|nr:hypothetical protein, conserved in T. vivax [Trypanosoma vivax Y486]|eukprot:CCD20562.1 hypothetical protein, conserved in T. vivax [Trypanosoma vivax Y486]